MKRTLVVIGIISSLLSLGAAIDDADGIGLGNMKIEVDTVLPGRNFVINYGLTDTLSGYVLIDMFPSTTLVGAGISYPLLSESRGDAFSLAPKVESTGWNIEDRIGYGFIISKRILSDLSLVGDVAQSKIPQGYFSWTAVGFVYDLNEQVQLTLESGQYSEDVSVEWLDFVSSKMDTAIGVNYIF
jgi:hypothetical protein